MRIWRGTRWFGILVEGAVMSAKCPLRDPAVWTEARGVEALKGSCNPFCERCIRLERDDVQVGYRWMRTYLRCSVYRGHQSSILHRQDCVAIPPIHLKRRVTDLRVSLVVRQQLFPSFLVQRAFRVWVNQQTFDRLSASATSELHRPRQQENECVDVEERKSKWDVRPRRVRHRIPSSIPF